jgi:predicted acyl esterase
MGSWIDRVVGCAALALPGLLSLAASAQAAPAPFGHACAVQNGVRFCPTTDLTARVPSVDKVPLDVDVTLPPSGDGPFPTIVMLHGWGGNKGDFEATAPEGKGSNTYHYNNVFFAQRGYAVLTYTARGFGQSCGAPASRTPPDCNRGYIRLADQRYEARDTQFLLGELVDQGISDPAGLGATGISYGGGQSLELAYLKGRVRKPDGSFAPWRSAKGTPLSLAAAFPRWLWSDLVDSLLPNGRFLDFQPATPRESRDPLGVPIQSYVSGLFALGAATGYYCGELPGPVPCDDSEFDLTAQFAEVSSGQPTPLSAALADQVYAHHQGFGLPGTPVPLLLESGWTDDLFPPHQSLRVYNALRAADPDAPVSLVFGDLGHSRGSNKENTNRAFNDLAAGFFDAHLKHSGTPPAPGSVVAFTQTCPASAPGGGPFRAASWMELHPGAVRFGGAAAQTVTSGGGNPQTGSAFDPIGGTSDACKTVAAERAPGTAIYEVASRGFTLMGMPTVRARVATTGVLGQLAARLWDVAPDGTQRLASRGNYRLLDDQQGTIVFQLHANAYAFDAGHTAKLELLGADAPYYRPSNTPFSVSVSAVTVELPTLQPPNGGQIVSPVLGRAARRLRLTVRPVRTTVGLRRLTFTVRGGTPGARTAAVRGSLVRIAGRAGRTDRRGRLTLTVRLRRSGAYTARASARGMRAASARVIVRRRRATAAR